MNCSEFMELLDNYELLSDGQLIELEKHCVECESCRAEYEFFKSIINVSSSIPVPETPKSLIADVNARIDSERAPIIRFKPNFRVLSTVAACLAIGLAVGINNGYIKKNIESNDADGIISETVITPTDAPLAEETKSAPVAEPVQTEDKKVESVVSAKDVQNTDKPTDKPVKSTPATTQKAQSTPQAKPSEIAKTEKPEQTPDNTPGVDDYKVEEVNSVEEHAYRRRFSTSKTSNQFSDYLYVKSEDMGAVVSTMSELGFVVSGGYYMGSRADFNELMNILSERGISYECMLQHNIGDNIAFNLQYS